MGDEVESERDRVMLRGLFEAGEREQELKDRDGKMIVVVQVMMRRSRRGRSDCTGLGKSSI